MCCVDQERLDPFICLALNKKAGDRSRVRLLSPAFGRRAGEATSLWANVSKETLIQFLQTIQKILHKFSKRNT
jgi:hypothetical protein